MQLRAQHKQSPQCDVCLPMDCVWLQAYQRKIDMIPLMMQSGYEANVRTSLSLSCLVYDHRIVPQLRDCMFSNRLSDCRCVCVRAVRASSSCLASSCCTTAARLCTRSTSDFLSADLCVRAWINSGNSIVLHIRRGATQ